MPFKHPFVEEIIDFLNLGALFCQKITDYGQKIGERPPVLNLGGSEKEKNFKEQLFKALVF